MVADQGLGVGLRQPFGLLAARRIHCSISTVSDLLRTS